MSNNRTSIKRVFVVFRDLPKENDAVAVVKDFFEKLSHSYSSRQKWQVDTLDSSLPSGQLLLTGVLDAVKRADLVIVVAGHISHNVAFELGLAYALNKDLILLAPKHVVKDIPETFSDIAGVKCAVYDPDSIMKLHDMLKAELHLIEADSKERSRSKAFSPEYHVALGDVLQLEGLHCDAIDQYQAASDLDPQNIRYLVLLGQAYAAIYDLSRAEEVLRKALNIDPNCALALDSLSQVLLDAGRYKIAIEDCLNPLIRFFPRTEAYYFKMAVAFTELGQPENAANFLDQTITNGLMLPRLFYDLAWTAARASIKYKAKEREQWVLKALHALRKAIELDPALSERATTDQDFDTLRKRQDFPQ
ncbi:MAG: hypothetical protein AB1401_06730 [Thermodesulfobacteriota bacterium]